MAAGDALMSARGKRTTKSGGLTAGARRASATIPPKEGYPSGRFPMPDKKHARLALQMLPKAHGLSSGQESAIRGRANRMLGK
jgi:hypothetical protein